MALIAVMRGNPKDGYTRQRSNKHCKQRLVWVLLDSGSDGDLIFVSKDKPTLLPYSKRLDPQLWNISNGIFQIKRKAWVELNFFETLIAKGSTQNLMWSNRIRTVSCSMTSFLAPRP
jgi:hypothetical protein